MPVTTQNYTVAAGYTASQLLTAFSSAMTDSGFALYDSDSSPVEFRVFEVVYDNTKTYGKTYYIFIASGADIFYAISSGWNTTSKIPAGQGGAGTQYLDWYSTTLSTSNSMRLTASTTAGFNSSSSVPIKRWTSAIRSNFSVIQIVNGTTNVPFVIEPTAPNNLVDLNREIYTSMLWPRVDIQSNTATAHFQAFSPILRGSHLGVWLRGITTASLFGLSATAVSPWDTGSYANLLRGIVYGSPGNQSGAGANVSYNQPVTQLFNRFNNTNSRFTTDEEAPQLTLLLNNYSSATLPPDFAFIPVYDSNTLQVGAEITISPTEKWTIIQVANATTLGNGPSMVFAARTT